MIKLQGPSRIMTRDEVLTVVRTTLVTYVGGKPTDGQQKSFKIKANVQPLEGRELLLVPEGDRYKEQYFIYSQAPVQVGDQITRCGVNFQVQQSEAWGSYYMARIMRIDVGPEATFGS